ncbi:hypothetical protein GALMADRAFT_131737 [Galerina marginata CBS 339.88]|uniref:Rad21/Rec8-like protein N-terminal domain-containing protein n=1 Tax=Galerina marginata (strain CBS 339.88) TaxID=685588 RepID=A0A067TRR4_GALM3|nr:hypothetical protein GALMADRAFT_131737 [Galerina marginata CBS 339.88]
MFFSPELLSKRDSGFGLLWLAATLGSRSTFKKLPKRSVLTADITQLCDLISEPEEPLALRLSSNLMFGVVRVYKGRIILPRLSHFNEGVSTVKQEIFFTDVTNCVATLKKVVQDLRASGSLNGQLLMPNPTVRASALTIVPDPKEAYALDYDAFVANWDEYLNIGDERNQGSDTILEDDDGDLELNDRKKKRTKINLKAAPPPEALRKEAHTLDEHHEHLLSYSFDLSITSNAPGPGVSSSQPDVGFDNFFPFSDGLGVGDGLGDDLARELGWAVSPVKSVTNNRAMNVEQRDLQFDNEEGFDVDMDFNLNIDDMPMMSDMPPNLDGNQQGGTPVPQLVPKRIKTPRKENNGPPSRMGSVLTKARPSPATSFSRLLLSQDDDQPLQPFRDITGEEHNRQNQGEPRKKAKRTRLLLDARTELTDDELKVLFNSLSLFSSERLVFGQIARAKYVESQKRLRREMMNKKLEKDNGRYVEELIWGVPKGIQEEGLINFWQENFKVQVEARSGILRIHQEEDHRPIKRRKITPIEQREENHEHGYNDMVQPDAEWGVDWGAGQLVQSPGQSLPNTYYIGNDMDMAINMAMDMDDTGGNRHSSEEPGQARRISRSASVLGASNLGLDIGPRDSGNGSQRSSLFPWDDAGPSSSSGQVPYGLPDVEQPVEHVEVRLRSSSFSRRDSPLAASHRGSMQAVGILFSPAPGGRGSQAFGEDFAFEVEDLVIPEDTQQDTQKSDLNLITLERNSYNFLEYARMQNQSLSKADGRLNFETVVPKLTSTRHVAAAAFYHCLVLATKNLLHLEQPNPYGSIIINIV